VNSNARASGGLSALANGTRLDFVALPSGTFRMGCATGDIECGDDELPARTVSVQAVQMSATEVTQEFWQAVMERNPSDFVGARQPVEGVSWLEAKSFAERLTESGDGFRYRLPTEAEWEYAARAGETTAPNLTAVAWFGLAAAGGHPARPQRVATKSPNRWGLFDTLGNVAEWCEDWYSPNYQRVVKGGAWDDGSTALRASARGKAVPSTRIYSIGVRLVREPAG
jgi:formylglycine-generating enzyme required for sulfatase activity